MHVIKLNRPEQAGNTADYSLMVGSKSRLESDFSIISTIKNNIPTQQLLSRLERLHEELSNLKQESVDLRSLERYRADLIDRKILRNKDHGVRAFAACCLSDILRLYAPDAPYTDKELTEIFRLFLAQLKLLQEPENGYLTQQTYLINNLLEYRSIVILTDLPSSSQLIEELFNIFYSPTNSTIQGNMFTAIGGILGEVISECDSLPMSALKMVFNKFLSHKRAESLDGINYKKDPGFEISLIICQTYSNRLGRHFIKFYSEIMYEVLGESDIHEKGIASSAYKTLVKIGNLTSELWKYAPELVGSVTGLLYQLLCSDNELFRESATKCVSKMLETHSLINFAVAHSDTYKIWLSKMADISPHVRQAWVSEIPSILMSRSDLSDDISKGLAKALIDSDHTVRLSAIQTFHEVPVKRLWECLPNAAVFAGLVHLTRETRRDLRDECIDAVARIYTESIESIPKTNENKEIWGVVETIPSACFNLYYINDLEINMKVDLLTFEKFLPLGLSNEEFVQRLLTLLQGFNEKAFSSFYAFNRRQDQMSTVLWKFIEFCEETNSQSPAASLSDTKLIKTVEWISSGFPSHLNVEQILLAFRELNDRRLYRLIKVAVAETSKHLTVRNAVSELFKRLEEPELFRKKNIKIESRFTRENFSTVFRVLIYRAAPIIFNISNLSSFLNTSDSSNEDEKALKRQLIDNISIIKPGIFKDQVKNLVTIITEGETTGPGNTLSLAEAMRTVYKISKDKREHLDIEENTFFFQKLEDYAKEGNPLEAKYAIKLLGLAPNAAEYLSEVATAILPLDLKSKHFASNVLVLAEITKMQPQLLEKDSTEIVGLLIKDVLLSNDVVGDEDDQQAWFSDEDIYTGKADALSAKVFSLKLFANKIKVMAPDAHADEMTHAFTERTLKLFFYLVASGGELVSESNTDNYPTPANYQNKLRCCAGLHILKITKIASLSRFIKPQDISKLMNLVEDESLEVRSSFIGRLKDFLGDGSISIKFLPLVFFTAYEPDQALRTSTKMWINYTLSKENFRKGTFFERALPRLIHFIAHHPDVAEGLRLRETAFLTGLTTAIDYLVFYADSVLKASNLALLYYLAGRVRQYRDAVTEEDNEGEDEDEDEETDQTSHNSSSNIYIISELAQLVLGEFKEHHEWTLSSYPGKLNLPSDLFEPFESIDEARKNTFKTYLRTEDTRSLRKVIAAKVSRLYRRTNVHKPLVQKRKNPESSSRPRKRAQASVHSDAELEDESEDDSYVPSRSRRGAVGQTRKSSRPKKAVDYADDESEED